MTWTLPLALVMISAVDAVGCSANDTLQITAVYHDIYAADVSVMGYKRHPDFQMPDGATGKSGFMVDCDAKKKWDLPKGCSFPDCRESECSYASIAGVGVGQVEAQLGADKLPVYRNNANDNGNPAHSIHSNTSFYSWWREVEKADNFMSPTYKLPDTITLVRNCKTDLFEFSSSSFFPLDQDGQNDETRFDGDDGKQHNFAFTTAFHAKFTYTGNEYFEFVGDDDVWVFIDDQLVIDMGGMHTAICRAVNLTNSSYIVPSGGNVDDANQRCPKVSFRRQSVSLNLKIGKTYDIDFFHAERHTTGSNFRIATNMKLDQSAVQCGCTAPKCGEGAVGHILGRVQRPVAGPCGCIKCANVFPWIVVIIIVLVLLLCCCIIGCCCCCCRGDKKGKYGKAQTAPAK